MSGCGCGGGATPGWPGYAGNEADISDAIPVAAATVRECSCGAEVPEEGSCCCCSACNRDPDSAPAGEPREASSIDSREWTSTELAHPSRPGSDRTRDPVICLQGAERRELAPPQPLPPTAVNAESTAAVLVPAGCSSPIAVEATQPLVSPESCRPPRCSFRAQCPSLDGECWCKGQSAASEIRCSCCCCCCCPCECSAFETSPRPKEATAPTPPTAGANPRTGSSAALDPVRTGSPTGEVPPDTRTPWGWTPQSEFVTHYKTTGCPIGREFVANIGYLNGIPVSGCYPLACPLPDGFTYAAGLRNAPCAGAVPAGLSPTLQWGAAPAGLGGLGSGVQPFAPGGAASGGVWALTDPRTAPGVLSGEFGTWPSGTVLPAGLNGASLPVWVYVITPTMLGFINARDRPVEEASTDRSGVPADGALMVSSFPPGKGRPNPQLSWETKFPENDLAFPWDEDRLQRTYRVQFATQESNAASNWTVVLDRSGEEVWTSGLVRSPHQVSHSDIYSTDDGSTYWGYRTTSSFRLIASDADKRDGDPDAIKVALGDRLSVKVRNDDDYDVLAPVEGEQQGSVGTPGKDRKEIASKPATLARLNVRFLRVGSKPVDTELLVFKTNERFAPLGVTVVAEPNVVEIPGRLGNVLLVKLEQADKKGAPSDAVGSDGSIELKLAAEPVSVRFFKGDSASKIARAIGSAVKRFYSGIAAPTGGPRAGPEAVDVIEYHDWDVVSNSPATFYAAVETHLTDNWQAVPSFDESEGNRFTVTNVDVDVADPRSWKSYETDGSIAGKFSAIEAVLAWKYSRTRKDKRSVDVFLLPSVANGFDFLPEIAHATPAIIAPKTMKERANTVVMTNRALTAKGGSVLAHELGHLLLNTGEADIAELRGAGRSRDNLEAVPVTEFDHAFSRFGKQIVKRTNEAVSELMTHSDASTRRLTWLDVLQMRQSALLDLA